MNTITQSLAAKTVAGFVAVVMTLSAFAGFATTASANTSVSDLCTLAASLGISSPEFDALCASDDSSDESSTAGAGQYVHHPSIDFEFTRNLYIGARGNDVKMLQTILNLDADTAIASGVGSAGFETEYFGEKTRVAVAKFQAKHGISPTLGYFYPLTRAEMNRKVAGPVDPTEPSDNDGEGIEVSEGDNPDEDLFPAGVLRFVVTAFEIEANEDAMVETVVVRYNGDADHDEIIDSVVILNEDMQIVGDEDSLDSDDEAEIDIDMEMDEGDSAMFYVAVNALATGVGSEDFDGNDGLDFTMEVVEIEADVDVDGLPVSGSDMTVQDNIDLGDVTVDVNHVSDAAMEIGSEEEEFVTVNIDANPDDSDDSVFVKSFRLENIENGDLDDLDNIYVEVDNDEFEADVDGDYIVFDFGDGIEIEESDDMDFVVYADVVGGAADTFEFVLAEAADMYVESEDGYGMPLNASSDVDDTGYAGAEGDQITISAGSASLSPSSEDEDEDITAGDVLLGQFDFEIEGEGIIAEDVTLTITINDGDVDDGDANDLLLEDVYIATADGDMLSDKEDAEWTGATPAVPFAGPETMEVVFDEIEFPEGDHEDLRVMATLRNEVADDTKYEITLMDFTVGDVEGMDSGEDVTVGTFSSFSQQTVAGSLLEVTISPQDEDETSDNVEEFVFAVLELDASDSGEDIEVTSVELQVTVSVATADAMEDITNCALYDGDDRVSSTEDLDENDFTAGVATYEFDLDDVVVDSASDEELELELRCDIEDDGDLQAGDTIVWEITATGANSNDEVEAEGVSTGNDGEDFVVINADAADLVTIVAAGLDVTEAEDNPDDSVVKTGTNKVTVLAVEVEGIDGTATIDDMTITLTTTNGDEVDGDDVEIYVDGDKKETLDFGGGATQTETNMNIEIDEDEVVLIELVVDVDSNATDAGTIVATIDAIVLEDGGSVEDGAGGAFAGTAAYSNTATVYEGVPVITLESDVDNDGLALSNTDYEVLVFSIEADGEDVVLDSVEIDVDALNGLNVTNAELFVYEDAALTNEFGTGREAVGAPTPWVVGPVLFDFTAGAGAITIDEGDTLYFVVEADVDSDGSDNGVLRVVIAEDSATGMVFSTPTGVTSADLLEDDIEVSHSRE